MSFLDVVITFYGTEHELYGELRFYLNHLKMIYDELLLVVYIVARKKNNAPWIQYSFFSPLPAVAFRLYDLDKDDKISRDELLQVNNLRLL